MRVVWLMAAFLAVINGETAHTSVSVVNPGAAEESPSHMSRAQQSLRTLQQLLTQMCEESYFSGAITHLSQDYFIEANRKQ